MFRLTTFIFVIGIVGQAGCGGANSESDCVCNLSEGTGDFQIACGETYCTGTRGYRCAAEQQVDDATCAPPDAPPDAPTPAKYQGLVSVEIRPAYYQGGRSYFEVGGGFLLRDDCQRSVVAGCQVKTCAYPLSSSYAAPGKISVGPTSIGGNYSWTPGRQWLDYSANTNDWAAGETVQVSWTGDTVPAAAMTAESPRTAEFTAYTGMTQSQIRTQDRQLSWLRINDPIMVRLSRKNDTGESIIECPFAAGTTGGSISSLVFAALPNPSPGYDFEEEVFGVNTTEQRVGDFNVQLRVLRGVEFSRLVRFE